MEWTFRLSKTAKKHLKNIDPETTRRILTTLKEISQLDNPRTRGKPLTGTLAGLWRYRVGKYRVVCDIYDHELVIFAVDIDHRANIYKHF